MIDVQIDNRDLKKIMQAFDELGKSSKRMLDEFLKEASRLLASNFKANLYGEKLPLVPLKAQTIQRKLSRGGDYRILIDTAQFVKSVRTKKIEKYHYFVGVPNTKHKSGINLRDLAMIHEYGSKKRNIPPRPAWAMTANQFGKIVPNLFEVFVQKHLLSFRKLI